MTLQYRDDLSPSRQRPAPATPTSKPDFVDQILRQLAINRIPNEACPLTGAPLDATNCVAVRERSGDIATVYSPEGFDALPVQSLAWLSGHGFHTTQHRR